MALSSPRRIDILIAGVLALATFAVHDVGYVLRAPFWVDEAWVAVSTRVSVGAISHVSATTPVGWTALLRVVVIGGDQRYRLLPLTFSALTVLAAYVFGRSIPWPSVWWARLAGAMTAVAVLLSPSALARNDLKQYTADAFITVLVLVLLSRLERSWSRRALVILAATCLASFLISAVALFVALAAFSSLILACLLRRQRRRAAETVVTGVGVGLGLGILFLVLYRPHVQKDLTAYWRLFYLPVDKGIAACLAYLNRRGGQMASYLGMGPLVVAILLVLAGVVTLALSGRLALALMGPMLLAEMIVLGAAKKYPLFDERTSHFLTIMFAVYAAIGVAGLASVLARQRAAAGVAVAVLATTCFAINVRHDIRQHSIPPEDVRTPTKYVAANRQAGDIVLVSGPASEGFSYYWPIGRPVWHPSDAAATHFQTGFPDQHDIVLAADRDQVTVQAILDRALAQAGTRPDSRIWLVRMHISIPENNAWLAALKRRSVQVTQVGGDCHLLLVVPAARATQAFDPQLAYCRY